jgi:hypothetical protein
LVCGKVVGRGFAGRAIGQVRFYVDAAPVGFAWGEDGGEGEDEGEEVHFEIKICTTTFLISFESIEHER